MTNRVRATFGRDHVLLPVVHPVDRASALVAVDVAVGAAADGVFLIDQGLSEREVLDLIVEVRARHPALWVGVNLRSHVSRPRFTRRADYQVSQYLLAPPSRASPTTCLGGRCFGPR